MNSQKIFLKCVQKSAFVLTFFIGVAAANVFAQAIDKAVAAPKQEKIELSSVKQEDAELINLAKDFAAAFKDADAGKMNALLADDFRYFTNVPCDYKDCERGAKREDYTNGIVEERKTRDFTIASVRLKYLKPIVDRNDSGGDKKVSFYCEVAMTAKGKTSKFYSFINYYFRKTEESWKITKIENQIVQ